MTNFSMYMLTIAHIIHKHADLDSLSLQQHGATMRAGIDDPLRIPSSSFVHSDGRTVRVGNDQRRPVRDSLAA